MTDRDSITRTRARAPGAEGDPPSMAVHRPVGGPAQYGATAPTLRCTKGDGKPAVSRRMPGAGLSLWGPGRPRLIGQPSSRTGENPPYGMSGGIEETSASFEARSAPRSYPTAEARVDIEAVRILIDTRQGLGPSQDILRHIGTERGHGLVAAVHDPQIDLALIPVGLEHQIFVIAFQTHDGVWLARLQPANGRNHPGAV